MHGETLQVEITDIKVYLVGEEKLRAFVSMVLDRCFMINDLKVIHGKDGLFVSMPSRRKKNGDFKDVAHPLNIETRSWMEEHILRAYSEALAERSGSHDGTSSPETCGGAASARVAASDPLY